MSLLDKASLIVTPNAYKESKLYSVVPNTPLGDMDVVRATTATRVNSAGLIEVVPRNLLTYSNTFTNAAWTLNNSTIETNSIISPDGTQNATKLNVNTTAYSGIYYVFGGATNIYTMSIFVKKGNKNWLALLDVAGNDTNAWFNISNGTLGTVNFGTATIIDFGNGWYKCTYTNSSIAIGNVMQLGFVDSNNSNAPSSSGFGYIYGAQVEQGSTATEYFPTTTRLNIPRIDYTNGSCPSLLVEPQRTNLLTYSEQLNQASWAVNATITANTTISPDGTQNADTILGSGFIGKVIVQTGIHTFSVFAKQGTSNEIRLNVFDGTTDRGAYYNLSNGTITSTYGTIIATNSVNYGNGWYRVSITTNNAVTSYVQIHRDSAQTCFIYGAQLELGSYATSYIPTVASTVTRNADVISKTGISSLIGQTEGVIYFENIVNFKNLSSVVTLPLISNSSNSDYIILYVIGDNIYADINIGFAYITTIQLGSLYSLNLGSTYKLAIQYNASGIKTYNNGVLIQTVSTVISNYSAIRTSSNTYLNNKAIILFKQYLTDAECIALTTL